MRFPPWGDLLTKYNGTAITYDTIGNPTSYYNGWNFTWKHGREMATATKSGQNLSFTYNADGLRTTKTVNGVVHTYYYSGSKLVRETYGDYVLDFFYDQSGTPFMLLQNGNIYYYITNTQGDVIRLVDINGNVAASYRYDPYGKATSALGSHANINPLRYRGYVFDHETGLYYLQSRYYDPETGRFINADVFTSTGQGLLGNNMFAYCGNNPINNSDPSGRAFFKNARELLKLWLDGTGEDQQYEQQDSLTRRIRNSDKMKEIVSNAIEQYKNGVDPSEWDSGQVTFYADDDQDLFLAARTCSYNIDITTQKKTTGAWFWKKEKEQIVVTVIVYDLYDFTPKEWDSFGNTINNIAWICHVVFDVGEDYWWYATYTEKTRWETVS